MAVKIATGASVCPKELMKAKEYDVTAYGASSEKTPVENTEAINRALKQAATDGGGCVVVPEGDFKVYTVRLQSNVNLRLEKGAVLRAARTDIRASYQTQEGEGGNYDEPEVNLYAGLQDHGHTYFANSMFYAADMENIMIYGEGLIEGSQINEKTGEREYVLLGGDPIEPKMRNEKGYAGEWFGNKCISLVRCKNVVLKDFSIVIGGHFAIIAEGVTNMHIEGLMVDTTRDALDVDCCKDVTVRDCVFNSLTDDALVLKASYGAGIFMPIENVLIENCTVSGYDAGSVYAGVYSREKLIATDRCGPTGRVKLGTESTCGYHQVTIRNVKFDRSRGFALEAVDGSDLTDILFEDCKMDNISSSPIFIRAGERGRFPVTGNSEEELIVCGEGNVRLDNCNWVLPNTPDYQTYEIKGYVPSYQKDKRVTVDGHSFFEIVDQREPARINEFNGPDYAKGNAKGYGRPAKVSDIEIRNVTITNADPRYPIIIMGLVDSKIENVLLENVKVSYRGGLGMEHAVEQRQLNTNWEYRQFGSPVDIQTLPWLVNTFFLKNEGLLPRVSWDNKEKVWVDDPYNVPELVNVYPEPSNWGILPAYGMYVRHGKNIVCRDVTLSTRVEDSRHPIVLADVEKMQLTNVAVDEVIGVEKVVAIINPFTRKTNREYLLNEPYFTTEVTDLVVEDTLNNKECLVQEDVSYITLTAPTPGTPSDKLYPHPTVPCKETGYTYMESTESYPLPVTVFRPFLSMPRCAKVKAGDVLELSATLKDPVSQATMKEHSGKIYNESVARDFVVEGEMRSCTVELLSEFAGIRYDKTTENVTWHTNEMQPGRYTLCFAISDEVMTDYQEVIVEIED